MEEQAIDRVHRLNQTQDVIVYKMTIKDTVEERILELQDKKRQLADATIEGKTAAAKLTMEDMLKLFRHDAEQTHQVDGVGLDLVARDRVLLESDAADTESYHSGGRDQRGPLDQKSGARVGAPQPRRGEDAVYGRRW